MIKDKFIAVSGINLYEGGTLSVYKDFLNVMKALNILQNNRVVLFVHSKSLFREYMDCAEIIELPKSRKNYIYRLYYEYVYFNKYSKTKSIDYWISMHDITPMVKAKHQFTYCHQPTPFYKPEKTDRKFSKKICLFSLFYKYLYCINIKQNDAVIVQQDWIRSEFKKKYNVQDVIVARPSIEMELYPKKSDTFNSAGKYTFIYAAFPRSFKNFEVICEACKILGEDMDYRVQLTIDGTENAYSQYLIGKYADVKTIEWIGIRPRSEIFDLYAKSDCMIFPSKLETWGLPISEYKQTGNPIIMADLPYAHETVGEYKLTEFFKYDDPAALAECMKNAILGGSFKEHSLVPVEAPYADNWTELCELIFRAQL